MRVTEPIGARKHDLTIFRENIQAAIFSETLVVDGKPRESMYSCMFDLSYLGVDRLLPSVLQVKRRAHTEPTVEERDFNANLGSHRILIETSMVVLRITRKFWVANIADVWSFLKMW